jgi:hypothetical protein
MHLSLSIVIRRNTQPENRKHYYGHEQRHVQNMHAEFAAIAWMLAADFESLMNCVEPFEGCRAEEAEKAATDRWKKFRADEAAHLHAPFTPANAATYLPLPIGTMPAASPCPP